MKKITYSKALAAAGAVLIASALIFAGCASSAASGKDSSGQPPVATPTTVAVAAASTPAAAVQAGAAGQKAGTWKASTPALLPRDVIDFSTWKLQLPIANESGSSVKEITGAEIEAGYSDKRFFYYDAAEKCVVFSADVGGFKTANTNYARSELREMIDPSNSAVNWGWTGTHILETSEAVTRVPSNGRTVVSQIHGIYPNGDNGPVLVKVEYDYTRKAVVMLLKTATAPNSADLRTYFEGVDLNQRFDTQIKCVNGAVYVTVSSVINGKKESKTAAHEFLKEDPTWKNYLGYFKAGNYVQDDIKDAEGEGATVKMYSLRTFHDDTFVEHVKVSQIALSSNEVTVENGSLTKLSTLFTPADATDKTVIWSVIEGQSNIALSSSGTVIARAKGTAVVEAVSKENPSAKARCTIRVIDAVEKKAVPIYSSFIPERWTFSQGGTTDKGTTAIEKSAAGERGTVFSFTDTDPTMPAKALLAFAPQTGTTTIMFDVRLDGVRVKDASGAKAQSSYIYLDAADASGAVLFRLRNKSDLKAGGVLDAHRYVLTNAYREITENTQSAKAPIGVWKKISMIVTPSDGSGNANTTDVYIDGLLVGEKIPNNASASAVSQLSLSTGTKDEIDFSVGNVQVFAGSVLPAGVKKAAPSKITINTSPSIAEVQSEFKFTHTAVPANSSQQCLYSIVSGSEFGAVSTDGLFIAVKPGKVTVRSSSAEDKNIFADRIISVANAVVRVERIDAREKQLTVEPGSKTVLSVSVFPENAAEKSLSYTIISGKNCVSVDDKGTLSALEEGQAVVRAVSLDNADAAVEWSVSVVSARKDGTVLFEDSFDKGPLDSSRWSTAASNFNNTVTEVRDGYLLMRDESVGGQPKAYIQFPPSAGTVDIQFDLYVEDDTVMADGKVSAVTVGFGTGQITSTANEVFRFKTGAETTGEGVTNRRFIYSKEAGQTGFYDMSVPYECGKWYSIRLVSTPSDGSDRANTTDIYINGVLAVEKAANKTQPPVIDKLIFQTATKDLTSFRIDNVKVAVSSGK